MKNDDGLEQISDTLQQMQDQQSAMMGKLDVMGKSLEDVKKTQGDHSRKLEALSGDMEQVLTEVKATHDEIGLWHSRDKREIDEIKRHVDLPIIPDIPTI